MYGSYLVVFLNLRIRITQFYEFVCCRTIRNKPICVNIKNFYLFTFWIITDVIKLRISKSLQIVSYYLLVLTVYTYVIALGIL